MLRYFILVIMLGITRLGMNWSEEVRPYARCHYVKYRKRLAEFHRARLRELDSGFRFREKSDELVRRRIEAREQGIGPDDPRYPSRDLSELGVKTEDLKTRRT